MNKTALRQYYLELRETLTPQEISWYSGQIAETFFAHWLPQDDETLHVFLPIPQKNEVNTWLIIEKIWRDFPQIQLLTSLTDWKNKSLSHCLFDKNMHLKNDKFNIPTPKNPTLTTTSHVDCVLVPLLVFDELGYRVGYGQGFYDSFLAECPVWTRKIGLSFFPPIPRIIDAHIQDVRLDMCIVKDQIWDFRPEK